MFNGLFWNNILKKESYGESKVPVTGEVRQRRQQRPEDDFKCASKLGTM